MFFFVVGVGVDGKWIQWLVWSLCSVSCENGIRYCIRNCLDFVLVFGGKDCNGISSEIENCVLEVCLSKVFVLYDDIVFCEN